MTAGLGCVAAKNMGHGDGPAPTHGPMAGDVTTTSAVIWARADGAGVMHVEVDRPWEKERAGSTRA